MSRAVIRIMTGKGKPQQSHATLSTVDPTWNLTEFLRCSVLFALVKKEVLRPRVHKSFNIICSFTITFIHGVKNKCTLHIVIHVIVNNTNKLGSCFFNQNLIREEIKRSLNLGIACYRSVQKLLSSVCCLKT
jgi:hypothetical protein